MKTFVIDASVIIKWIFPDHQKEDYIPQAIHLLQSIKQETIKIIQPIHWLAEVVAVVVRLEPKIAAETVDLLNAMDFPIINDPEIYHTACMLAERFNHHLFDTLYHAVALHHGNTHFVTADDQYYRKTAKQGSIIRLADFSAYDD
jgi:predicted nucleic acid-binding protein